MTNKLSVEIARERRNNELNQRRRIKLYEILKTLHVRVKSDSDIDALIERMSVFAERERTRTMRLFNGFIVIGRIALNVNHIRSVQGFNDGVLSIMCTDGREFRFTPESDGYDTVNEIYRGMMSRDAEDEQTTINEQND